MKFTQLLLCLLLGTVSQLAAKTNGGQMSAAERDWLKHYQEESAEFLSFMLRDVDAAAWTHRPAENRWSIAECAEHILIAEKGILQQVRQLLTEGTPDQKKTSAVPSHDEIVNLVTDRINKRVKTIEPFEPSGQWASKEDFMAAFTQQREAFSQFVKVIEGPVHQLFVASPFGEIDAYQYLVVGLAHTMRHTLQVEEIKAGLGLKTTTIHLEGSGKLNLSPEAAEKWTRLFRDILQQSVKERPEKLKIRFTGGGVLPVSLKAKGPESFSGELILSVPDFQWDSVRRRLTAFGMTLEEDRFVMDGLPVLKLNRQ